MGRRGAGDAASRLSTLARASASPATPGPGPSRPAAGANLKGMRGPRTRMPEVGVRTILPCRAQRPDGRSHVGPATRQGRARERPSCPRPFSATRGDYFNLSFARYPPARPRHPARPPPGAAAATRLPRPRPPSRHGTVRHGDSHRDWRPAWATAAAARRGRATRRRSR